MALKVGHPFEFDARMVEWNLKHNLITRDDLKKYLSTLPDDGGNTQTIEIAEEEDFSAAE